MPYYPKTRRAGRRRGGTSLVEFALVIPMLLSIVLGIIEFGLLERSTLVVANAAREGARAAALGQSTPSIRTRVINAGAPALQTDSSGNITNGSILMEQAASGTSPLAYTAWPADTGSGTTQKNSVPAGNYVRITVTYNHRSLTGLFKRTVIIPAMMRREG